jgi:hypothetical protein
MTDDEIVKAMAAQGYTQQADGTWLRKTKPTVALCVCCFARPPVRGHKRCSDCGTRDHHDEPKPTDRKEKWR